jgi:hypothetical protein
MEESMKQFWIVYAATAVLFLSLNACFADTTDSTESVESVSIAPVETGAASNVEIAGVKINQSGFVGLEACQIVKGLDYSQGGTPKELEKSWQERLLLQFVNTVSVSKRIRIILAIEAQMTFSYPQDVSWPETQRGSWSFYPDRAEGTYTCGDTGAPFLQFGFGYFPFRTNPDVRNLGEFLFRSGTYPVYVINSFNRPYQRLLGLRASSTLFGTLHQDLLLTSDYALNPVQDWSLSYLISYTAFKCIDIGLGISLARFFSVDKRTSPTDPGNLSAVPYVKENGDTGYYTFKGTKPMARLAFDPKPLLPSFISNIFGKNDFRLYGEVCVTGWNDYKNYDPTIKPEEDFYNRRSDRTLTMVGFNIPAFKVFDVLSLEFEHFPNKYPNSYQNVYSNIQPTPLRAIDRTEIRNPYKWSLYVKRTFLKNFAVIGQVARDHFVLNNANSKIQIKEDLLFRPGDMWWVLRLNVNY